jgi:hypothetical protein
MIAIDDRPPTVAERYSTATRSSNLRVAERRNGDADVLIAAGWSENTLGALLYRLHAEFDVVRAEVRQGPLNATERLLILGRLKTLRETKEALGAFAIQQATRRRYMQPDKVVLQLVGRVLDVHMDPLCPHCEGRGFVGGSHRGEKQAICRPCRGTGHRKEWVGKDSAERWFARHLLCEMDRVSAVTAGRIARRLRRT